MASPDFTGGEIIWQVAYEDLVEEGIVWWDLPKMINDFIEEQRSQGLEMIEYNWPWQSKGDVTYVMDTVGKKVINTQTKHTRRVRRIFYMNEQ